MIGSAVAAVAIGVGTFAYGVSQDKKSEQAYQDRLDEAENVNNPYAGLQESTLGSRYRGQQALRSEATQMNMLSKSGSRGLAYVPQVARATALTAQSEASDLDRQRARIDQLKAGGEVFVQRTEEARLNQDLQGYAQMYATGQQNIAGGINQATGALASGFAEGGAFNQPQQTQQLRPYATGVYPPPSVGTNLQGFQPTALRPQQLIPN